MNKPAGITSRGVVDRIQRLVRPAKVGHAGTLDPLATGVLVVCIGPATRLISLVQDQPKQYHATFRLGWRSDTDDAEGILQETPDVAPIAADQLERLLPEFVGLIDQRPPSFSAVHVQGQRAYDLARQGATLDLAPRKVHVERLTLARYSWPDFELDIDCGSGTYVRSIGRDLGERLGCGAIMTALTRTRIGPFSLDQALDLEQLNVETLQDRLLPPLAATANLPRCEISPTEIDDIRHGRAIAQHATRSPRPAQAPGTSIESSMVALVSTTGELIAIATIDTEAETFRPTIVFPATPGD